MKLWTEWDLLLRAGVKTEFLLLLGQRVLTTLRPKDTDRQARSSESGLTSEGSGTDSLSIRDLDRTGCPSKADRKTSDSRAG